MDTVQNTTDRTSIEAYLELLRCQRRLSQNTIDSYLSDLTQLTSFTQTQITEIDSTSIRRLVAKMHASGIKARSIARKLSAWRRFFQWLIEKGTLTINPVEDIRAPKRDKPLPKALSVDDAIALVSHTNKQSESPQVAITLCNRAMFELLYSSGLRVSELTSIDCCAAKERDYVSTSWIDQEEKLVHVTGKANKTRTVPVGEPALKAIQAWLTVRQTIISKAINASDRYALFINTRGKRISQRLIEQRLDAHAKAIGLPMHVHPHMLRHSFASHILQSSSDLRAVQEMLGHSSIAATQIYTALDFQHLATIYDQTHPHAKTPKKPKT